MTHARALPASAATVCPMGGLSRGTIARIRDMVLAAAIVLAATVVLHAQERMTQWTQDWVPAALTVPEDAELMTDRAVGSTIRLFSFSTGMDVDRLFIEWETALQDAGYVIDQGAGELLERSIEFSGTGISNAKIVAGVTADDGRTVIEVDATLE